jgi:hypothetical protein
MVMGKRHEAIGIKQIIRFEWMEKTFNLLLSGLEPKKIRQELHEYLSKKKGSGSTDERGLASRTQVVNMLMKIWVLPNDELQNFRDACLAMLQQNPSMALVFHWGMISAAYPFWSNVAGQIGRILALQDQVTQSQIFYRLKELYGDRETVARYARYTVRSMVAWGVLGDTETKGSYAKVKPVRISDTGTATVLVESLLYTRTDRKAPLDLVRSSPSLFPFQLHQLNGDALSVNNPRLQVTRYGLYDDLVQLV